MAATIPLTTVHLSPHAPGCAGLDLSHQDRWPVLIGLTADGVARAVIHRLGVRPSAVQFRECTLGKAPVVDVLTTDREPRLLAVIFDTPPGVLTQAHDALVAASIRRAA